MPQLSPRIESFGPGDQSWLGSDHGVDEARTITLNISEWASKIVDGYIKSGEPAAKAADGRYVPYDSTGSAPADVLQGFVVVDVPVVPGAGDVFTALMDHGRIVVPRLPSPIPDAPTTTGLFVFVDHP